MCIKTAVYVVIVAPLLVPTTIMTLWKIVIMMTVMTTLIMIFVAVGDVDNPSAKLQLSI